MVTSLAGRVTVWDRWVTSRDACQVKRAWVGRGCPIPYRPRFPLALCQLAVPFASTNSRSEFSHLDRPAHSSSFTCRHQSLRICDFLHLAGSTRRTDGAVMVAVVGQVDGQLLLCSPWQGLVSMFNQLPPGHQGRGQQEMNSDNTEREESAIRR